MRVKAAQEIQLLKSRVEELIEERDELAARLSVSHRTIKNLRAVINQSVPSGSISNGVIEGNEDESREDKGSDFGGGAVISKYAVGSRSETEIGAFEEDPTEEQFKLYRRRMSDTRNQWCGMPTRERNEFLRNLWSESVVASEAG